MNRKYADSLLSLMGAVSLVLLNTPFAQAANWTFQVTNSGKFPILSVEASEDGTTWGQFVGSAIQPGTTETMEWSSATDDSNCVWQVRAVYEEGRSEPASFDFCKQPTLEFSN